MVIAFLGDDEEAPEPGVRLTLPLATGDMFVGWR
jgi:hypothetical protein